MKNLQILFLFFITSFTTSAQLVVQVYDGDTYKILHEDKLQIIRLANVDAPELGQYYGTVAKNGVSKLILGKQVKIHDYGLDRYGRSIAAISINGNSLDSTIIANGWAWYSEQYSFNHCLFFYEKKAREAKIGMWRCKYNVPPWIWRRLSKEQKRLNEMCR